MLSFSTLGNVRISGRLGNQMFQYAALRGAAERLGVGFRCPEWLGDAFFQLDEAEGQRSVSDEPAAGIFQDRKNLTFDPSFLQIEDETELKGYFQSENYFHEPTEVKRWFQFREDVVSGVRERYREVDFAKTVSLHLRMGDYLKLSKVYPVQDVAYYEHALRTLFSEGHSRGPGSLLRNFFGSRVVPNGWKVLVFSDDIPAARERLESVPSTVFVDGNADYEDLWLMTQCRHHIMANSSFSWWGAWLGDESVGETIAPANWFTEESGLESRDIYASGWKAL